MMHSSVLLLCIITASSAFSQDRAVPKLTSYVYDETRLLNAAKLASLDSALKSLHAASQVRIAAVIIDTLGGYEINELVTEIGNANQFGIGSEKAAIILVSLRPRKTWLAPSRVLEPLLPNSTLQSIYESVLRPGLQSGDFYHAFTSTAKAMIDSASTGSTK